MCTDLIFISIKKDKKREKYIHLKKKKQKPVCYIHILDIF